jgi:hypothetical protein
MNQEEQKVSMGDEELSEALMKEYFLELSNSIFWKAIRQFAREKDALVINSLIAIDPFKDPTTMCRIQGIRQGLYYLEEEITRLVAERNGEAANTNNDEQKK